MLYVNPVGEGNATGISLAKDPEKKQKMALQELEHLFLYSLVHEMRKTASIVEDPEKSSERDFYNDMLDDALSGQMAASGQLGVAKQIEDQIRSAKEQIALRRTFAERDAQTRRELSLKTAGIPSDI